MANKRYLCPSCRIPILVGEHSITIDSKRIRENAVDELISASKDIRDNHRADCHVGFYAIELPKLERLRDALTALTALESSKRNKEQS